jgi:hypothetical protein
MLMKEVSKVNHFDYHVLNNCMMNYFVVNHMMEDEIEVEGEMMNPTDGVDSL